MADGLSEEMSIKLVAQDVNVKDTFNELTSQINQFKNSVAKAFDLGDIQSAVNDIKTMTSEIQNTTQKVNALSNNLKGTLNEIEKIGKSKGITKVAQQMKEVENGTKTNSFSKYSSSIEKVGDVANSVGTKITSSFDNAIDTHELIAKFNEVKEKMWEIRDASGNIDFTNTTSQEVTDLTNKYQKLIDTLWSSNGVKLGVNLDTGELVAYETRINSLKVSISNMASEVKTNATQAFNDLKYGVSNLGDYFPRLNTAINTTKRVLSGLGSINLAISGGQIRDLASSFEETKNKVSELNEKVKSLISRFKQLVLSNKSATNSNNDLLKGLKSMANRIIVNRILIRQLASGIMSLGSTLWSALKTNDQFSQSLSYIKGNLATAFMPIYNAVLPALNALMSAIAKATSYIASLINSIFGVDFSTSLAQANALASAMEDTADSTASTADSASDATEEFKKQLHPLDEINNLTTDEDTDDGSSGSSGSGSSASSTLLEGFESNIDSIKALLEELFEPIKNSWAKYGQGVVDSMQYAFESCLSLIKSIGSSFKEVWLNGTGEQTVDYILLILTNIFNTIGNIASAFDDAWNHAGTGTAIVQALWNAFNNVLGIIYDLTTAIEKWSAQADFTPLLTSVKNVAESFENLTSVLRDALAPVFDTYITPALNYITETALPLLVNAFSSFIDLISEGIENIEEVFNVIRGSWLVVELAPLLSSLGGLFTTLGGTISEFAIFVGNAIPGLSSLTTMFTNISPLLSTLFSGFGALSTVIEALINPVTLLGGAFFYLLGTNDYVAEFVNDLIDKFNNFYKSVDFTKIAEDFSSGLSSMFSTIADGIRKLDWNSLGSLVAELISGVFEFIGNIDFTEIARGLGESLEALIESAVDFLQGIDFSNMGQQIGKALANIFEFGMEFILGLDWGQLAIDIISLLVEALTDLGTLIANTAVSLGENIILGLIEGIATLPSKVVEFFTSMLDAVKEFLGISSPSKVFAEIGENIVNGLINGIDSIISGVVSVFSGVVESIKETLNGIVTWLTTTFQGAWSTVTSTISSLWSTLSTTLQTVWTTIKTNVFDKFTSVLNTLKSLWDTVTTSLSSVFTTMKDKFISIYSSIKTSVFDKFTSIINTFKTTFSNVVSNLKTTFEGVKTKFVSIYSSIKSSVFDKFTSIINTFKSTFSSVFSSVKTTFTGVKDKLVSVYKTIKSSVFDKLTSIVNSFKSTWSSAWTTIKNKFSSIWSTMKSVVKTPLNCIIGYVNKMLSGVQSGINYIVKAINKLSFTVPSWVPSIGGKKFGFNLSTISISKIPTLAEGGIAYGDTLAYVGEYQQANTNPEVIAPLDKLSAILDGIMYDSMKTIIENSSSQYDPSDYDIVNEITLKTDNEVLAKQVAKGKAKIERKTGKELFST